MCLLGCSKLLFSLPINMLTTLKLLLRTAQGDELTY